MIKSTEALKHFRTLEKQKPLFPNAHIYANIEKTGVNLEELALKKPYLYDIFTSLFSGAFNEAQNQAWKQFVCAYNELESKNCLNVRSSSQLAVDFKVKEFIDQVNGPLLITPEKIEKIVSEVIDPDGKHSFLVDFNAYVEFLEKSYNFDFRDFFGSLLLKEKSICQSLGISFKEYEEFSQEMCGQHEMATKIQILEDLYIEKFAVNLDFWQYFLKRDFYGMTNGSVLKMWPVQAAEDEKINKVTIPGDLFEKMRELFFKEVKQIDPLKIRSLEDISFDIYW